MIVIDSNEGAPYQFKGLTRRVTEGGVKKSLPLVIQTTRKAMWTMGRAQYGAGLADYSIDGFEEQIQVERKSLEDLFASVTVRRDNFEAEIASLNQRCQFAAVVVEAGWSAIQQGLPDSRVSPRSVIETIVAWQQRYPRVHWLPFPTRDMAERMTFRVLDRFWRDQQQALKEAAKCSGKN
jgi:hypothetical protein